MSQSGETAGSILHKLLLAREVNASSGEVDFLEQELVEQMRRQSGDETIKVTISVGDKTIPPPRNL